MIIGNTITITEGPATQCGLSGTVVDETKHTITIMTEHGEKKLIKNAITYTIKRGTT